MTGGRTQNQLSHEQKMEFEYQMKYINKLKENMEAIARNYKGAQQADDNAQKIQALYEFVLKISHSLVINDSPYSAAELTEIISRVQNNYAELGNSIPAGVYDKGDRNQQNYDYLSGVILNTGIASTPLANQSQNLLTVGLQCIEEFREGNTRGIRSEGIRELDKIIKINNKNDLIKAIVSEGKDVDANSHRSSIKNKAKIFAQTHLTSSRNQPALQVIKLISKLKEGDTPAIHKHNTTILKKIMESCMQGSGKISTTSPDTAISCLQDKLAKEIITDTKEIFNGKRKQYAKKNEDPLSNLASAVIYSGLREGHMHNIIQNTNSNKSQKFLASIYLYASGVMNPDTTNAEPLAELKKNLNKNLTKMTSHNKKPTTNHKEAPRLK